MKMLHVGLRIFLLSSFALCVTSSSLTRELHAMISDDQKGNSRDNKRRELDVAQSADAENKNPVKRMHHLSGSLKFGGGRKQFGSPWHVANPFFGIQKREKDFDTKKDGANRGLEKRVHRLQGNLQFGSGSNGHLFGYPFNWQSPFLKRKKDDNTKGTDSDLKKRKIHSRNNADKDGSDDWMEEFWKHAFRGMKRGADNNMKTEGNVDDDLHKRRHLQTKLKFGGNFGGLQSGRSSWSHNAFRNINKFQ